MQRQLGENKGVNGSDNGVTNNATTVVIVQWNKGGNELTSKMTMTRNGRDETVENGS